MSHDHAAHAAHDHSQGGGMSCCTHGEMQSERSILLYMVGGVLLLASWLSYMAGAPHEVAQLPAIAAAIMLAVPLFYAAWIELRYRQASSSTLAAIAILAALVMGKFGTAGSLAFILLVADQVVRRTASGAKRAIDDLIALTPKTARVIENGVEREIHQNQVQVGQTVRVLPGENVPVDGKVLTGRSTINQAALTGEAVPVEVQAGDLVYAGTTNLTGAVDVAVTHPSSETAISRVQKLIHEAETTRTPRQLLIQQVAGFFVPIALGVAAVTWFVKSQGPNPDQAGDAAIAVLIVTCPAALLLSAPSAMVAAFAAAARLGILIKETSYLEASAHVDAVVFDKTGTITTGKFEVAKLAPAEGVQGAELLKAAANGERHSSHPLAQSILTTARAARIEPEDSKDFQEIHGRGVRAKTSMGELCVGRASWLMELQPTIKPQVEAVESKIEGMTGVHVMRDGKYLGAVGLEDKVRTNARTIVSRLRELGAKHVALFTGDRLTVAKRVGQAIGVDAIEAECLPEEKHELIRGLTGAGYRTMMVGDGINDGPSLAQADVGVAMGLGGSDIAANSAGVALMNDDLSRIPFLVELARRTRVIIAQNIAASIVIVLIGLVLAATGLLAAPAAAFYHFVGDVFVLGNSFRLFRFGEGFADAEPQPTPTMRRRAASVRGMMPQPQPQPA